MSTLSEGDWVYSYSPGVWQVYRILKGFYEPRYSLKVRKVRSNRTIVFVKRLVDRTWKRRFGTDSCEQVFIHPLPREDRNRVDHILYSEPKLLAAFDAYVPPPIPLITNLALGIEDVSRVRSFGKTVLTPELKGGISLDRVLVLLNKARLLKAIGKMPMNAILQLKCRDHEVRNREFIFREWRVFPL